MARLGLPTIDRRKSSTPHYQTFPTPPPKSRGQPPSVSPPPSYGHSHHDRHDSNASDQVKSPLPTKQLAMLAFIVLSEQTALNSISPYLPQMASSFPGVDPSDVGVYVGTIVSAFALAQFATNFFWGWLSDRIGRKPVILTGTLLTAACLVAFGFCRTFWQAVLAQTLMGLVNGNQGVVATCLGEITDRSNQSRAFIYLPVVYGLGAVTGPIVGGFLVAQGAQTSRQNPYPHLPPNLLSAGVLMLDLVLSMLFLEESLEEGKDLPPLGTRVRSLFSWVWQFASSSRPSYLKISNHQSPSRGSGEANMEDNEDSGSSTESCNITPTMRPHRSTNIANLSRNQVLTRNALYILSTYFIFQLSNVSYNSLYPIFGQASPPTGRGLSPKEIGVSLSFAGAATIFFQVGVFERLRDKIGNRITYRSCLGGIVLAYIMTPFVGYKNSSNGKIWLYVELGFVLLVRSLAGVGCLTSALLLVCSSIDVGKDFTLN